MLLLNFSFNLAKDGVKEKPKSDKLKFHSEPSIPGEVEGKGTYFEIKDNQYLNITLNNAEKIKVILELIPRTINLIIQHSFNSTSTKLALAGLEPNKTYFLFFSLFVANLFDFQIQKIHF